MSRLRKPRRRRSLGQMDGRLNLTTEYGDDDLVLYVEFKLDGERFTPVAKRYPGQNWISLEPGWTVIRSEPGAKYGVSKFTTMAGAPPPTLIDMDQPRIDTWPPPRGLDRG